LIHIISEVKNSNKTNLLKDITGVSMQIPYLFCAAVLLCISTALSMEKDIKKLRSDESIARLSAEMGQPVLRIFQEGPALPWILSRVTASFAHIRPVTHAAFNENDSKIISSE
jgi:hypothetical protein